jgi:D-threo-aldose 1-dehydrogenase
MAMLEKRGVSVIIGAPFASGILATGSGGAAHYGYGVASPDIQAKVRRIEDVCQAHAVALPAAALQFVLAHPNVVSVIPGATSAREVRQNAASLAARIPAVFWSDLKAQSLIDPAAPVPADAVG